VPPVLMVLLMWQHSIFGLEAYSSFLPMVVDISAREVVMEGVSQIQNNMMVEERA